MPTLPQTTPLPVVTSRRKAPQSPLARELKQALRGEVREDALSRTIYSTDASLYEIVPACVVLPRDANDVQRTVEIAARHQMPISARGAGTGINGGSLGNGITLDVSKYMTKISDVDAATRTVRVQPGVVLDDLNAVLAEHDLFFPPDVAPSSRATVGGMIANNSCGAHSIYYGRTVDYIAELTVVLADSTLHTWHHHPYRDLPEKNGRTPQIPFIRRENNEPTVGRVFNPHNWETEAPAEQSVGRVSNPPENLQEHGTLADPFRADTLPSAIATAINGIRTNVHDEVIDRYPRVLRRNGGYALDRLCLSDEPNPATLICGSEGTLGVVVEAKLRLVPKPNHAALLVVQFDSVFDAVGATPAILQHNPAAVELLDDLLLNAGAPEIEPGIRGRFLTGIPKAILVCELYTNDDATLHEKIATLDADLQQQNIGTIRHRVHDKAVQAAVWEMRKRGFGLLMSRPGHRQPHEFIEDAAVDPADLREYLEQLTAAVNEEGCADLGYYAHASVGVIHVRPVLNLFDNADVEKLARIAERSRELVAKFGGAFTGEHGDGLVRSWSLEKMYGPRIIEAFRLLKNAFDPHNLLNPNKIVNPPPITANLRYRNKPRPIDRELYFDYGEHEDMAGLAGMCTGVGQCRQKLVGTMCPSYMATLEEQHTTRARAVALRAALHGEGLLDGLDDPALHDAMDLCLSCKACKTECPTGVDMARLKSEWLAQTYKKTGVPASAKFIASVPQNLQLAAFSPSLANLFQGNAFTRMLLEKRYGLDRRVAFPPIAKQTFRQWFASRGKSGGRESGGQALSLSDKKQKDGEAQALSLSETKGDDSGAQALSLCERSNTANRSTAFPKQVVYFADTWTNYFWPEVGQAAVRLLEAIGCEVLLPRVECCGRPAISKGLLDDARKLAQKNAAILSDYARRGIPILGSEPSCILTFIDELPHFVRTDEAKQIAANTKTVEQFLYEHRDKLADAFKARATNPNPLRQAGGQDATKRQNEKSRDESSESNGPTSTNREILFHGHCHQKALIGTSAANALLDLIPNRTARELNTGCCGMAGSFGHEKAHYDIARAVGEQRLFPAVRENPTANIVVCGFSCREQLQHHCDVRATHVLELLSESLK